MIIIKCSTFNFIQRAGSQEKLMVLLHWLVEASMLLLLLMSCMAVAQHHVVSTNTCESLYKELNLTCNAIGGNNSCINAFDGDVAKTQWVGVSAGSDASMWPLLSVNFGTPRLSTGYVIVSGTYSIGRNYSWMLLGSNDGKLGTVLDSRDHEVSQLGHHYYHSIVALSCPVCTAYIVLT